MTDAFIIRSHTLVSQPTMTNSTYSGALCDMDQAGQHKLRRGTIPRRRGALVCFVIGCSVLYFHSPSSSNTMRRSLSTEDESGKETPINKRPLLKLLAGGQRLGDQLFMYASHLGLAQTHDMDSCIVKTDRRLPLEQLFVGPIDWCDDGEYDVEWEGGWRAEKISQLKRQDNDADLVYGLSGYMHSPRNFVAAKTPSGDFVDYSDLLYEKLTLRTDTEYPSVEKISDEMRSEGERDEDESTKIIHVGIHVRRGDKVDDPKYTVAGTDYYRRAMEYLRKKYNRDCESSDDTEDCPRTRVKFHIVTDTISWIDENDDTFEHPDVVLLSNAPEREEDDNFCVMIDFAMLTKCDHIILSGGGFGFWAAYLGAHQNGGEVIIGSAQEHLKTRTSSLEEWTNIDEIDFDEEDMAAVE